MGIKRIARALCQEYFALQYAKCLFSKPGLTGFSFSKEVCVYLSARDDFDLLVHLTYEWEAGQLFYSPLQLAQEAEYIDHRIELIRDYYLPTVVTHEDDCKAYAHLFLARTSIVT
jgi:hypothetical protein